MSPRDEVPEGIGETMMASDSTVNEKNEEYALREESALKKMKIPCLFCGELCKPVLNRKALGEDGKPSYPAELKCKCGRETLLDKYNDGYGFSYHYPGTSCPWDVFSKVIMLNCSLEGVEDQLKRADILDDLAVALIEIKSPDAIKASEEALGICRDIRMTDDVFDAYVKAASVAMLAGVDVSEKAVVTPLKKRIDEMDGIYGALFAALCCFESSAEKNARKYADTAIKMLNESGADDCFLKDRIRMIVYSGLAKFDDYGDDAHDIGVNLLYNLAERTSFDDAYPGTARMMCTVFEEVMNACYMSGSTERIPGVINGLRDRFRESDRFPVVDAMLLFRSALYKLTVSGEVEAGIEDLKALEDIVTSGRDNGQFTMYRFAYAEVLRYMFDTRDSVLLMSAMRLVLDAAAKGMISKENVDDFITVFLPAAKEGGIVDAINDFLMRNGMKIWFTEAMVRSLEFDATNIWTHSLPFRV